MIIELILTFLLQFPGQEQTPIEVIHTGHLRQVESLRGKRVLVIGGSISAGDIAEAAAEAGAAQVSHEMVLIWLIRPHVWN